MGFLALSTHCYKITKHVRFPLKHDSHLRQICEDEYYDYDEHDGMHKTVRLFSETRWTVHGVFKAVLTTIKS